MNKTLANQLRETKKNGHRYSHLNGRSGCEYPKLDEYDKEMSKANTLL